MQLVCFPFAGGTSSFFDQLDLYLAGKVTLCKMEYAGHGIRHREPLYATFAELAEDLYQKLSSSLMDDGRYALFGYSMGCISVLEVLRRVVERGELPFPVHVFLAAHEPQTKRELLNFTPTEQDEWIRQRTIDFGGIPEKLQQNKSFWRIYLPIYRADYLLIGNYDFTHIDFTCRIPTTVFYSQTDTCLADMIKWKRFFTGPCDFCCYEGQHFFIRQHAEEMADVIKEKLSRDEI